jgi:hypothetical protein
MDMNKMLAELRAERENREQAIITLQRLVAGRGQRRGRPPKWMAAVKRRGRPAGNKPKDSRGASIPSVAWVIRVTLEDDRPRGGHPPASLQGVADSEN